MGALRKQSRKRLGGNDSIFEHLKNAMCVRNFMTFYLKTNKNHITFEFF